MTDGGIPTMKNVLDRLQAENLINETNSKGIRLYLEVKELYRDEPAYLRWISGIGAWVCVVFLMIFISIGLDLFNGREGGDAMFFGIVCIGTAMLVSKTTENIFLKQFGIALALTGNIIIQFAILLIAGSDFSETMLWITMTAAQTALCLVTYFVINDPIYRFFSVLGIGVLSLFTVTLSLPNLLPLQLLFFVQIAGAGIAFYASFDRPQLKPVYRAFFISVIASVFTLTGMSLTQPEAHILSLWLPGMVSALALAGLQIGLAGGLGALKSEWMIIAVAATILAGVFLGPAIIVAIALLLLGYTYWNRSVIWLGYGSMAAAIPLIYARLDAESPSFPWILVISGIVILLLRWLLSYRPWARTTTEEDYDPANIFPPGTSPDYLE
jgi:hypothetical protein